MWEIFGTQNSPFVTIHTITTQRKTSLLFTWCNAWSPKNLGTRYRLPLVFTDNRYHHELSILQLLTLTNIAYVTYLSRVANNNFPERFCCGKKAFLKQKKNFWTNIVIDERQLRKQGRFYPRFPRNIIWQTKWRSTWLTTSSEESENDHVLSRMWWGAFRMFQRAPLHPRCELSCCLIYS